MATQELRTTDTHKQEHSAIIPPKSALDSSLAFVFLCEFLQLPPVSDPGGLAHAADNRPAFQVIALMLEAAG